MRRELTEEIPGIAPSETEFLPHGGLEAAYANLSDALRAAVGGLRRPDATDSLDAAAVEACVRAFATEARLAGAPPERMIVLLKRCIEDTPGFLRDDRVRHLIQTHHFGWALDAYYGAN